MKKIIITNRFLLIISMMLLTLMLFNACTTKHEKDKTNEKQVLSTLLTDANEMMSLVTGVYKNGFIDYSGYDTLILVNKVNDLYFSIQNEFVQLKTKVSNYSGSLAEQILIRGGLTDLTTLCSEFITYYYPSKRTEDLEQLLKKYMVNEADAIPERNHKKDGYTPEDVIKELKAFSNWGRCLSMALYDNVCDTIKSTAVNKNYTAVHYTSELETYHKMQNEIDKCMLEAGDFDGQKGRLRRTFKRALQSIRAFEKLLPAESNMYDAQTNLNLRFFHDRVTFWNNKKLVINE